MNGPARKVDSVPNIPGYSGLELIGEGANARVYRAVQDSLGRNIALKVLKRSEDQARLGRFLNESRLIASINHPNVITIHDVGEVDDLPYIAMEWLSAGDLESRLRHGALSPDESLELIDAIGTSLSLVHEKGIMHRDIKPANIMFRDDGTPVLTDFGVAKQMSLASHHTIEGIAVGTPYYLSPEQAQCKALDGRTDLYALGVILYEMLTGRRPFEGASATETIVAHLTEPVPSLPRELAGLQELIDYALAKDPEDRFASVRDMLVCLRRLRETKWNETFSGLTWTWPPKLDAESLKGTLESLSRRLQPRARALAGLLRRCHQRVGSQGWIAGSVIAAFGIAILGIGLPVPGEISVDGPDSGQSSAGVSGLLASAEAAYQQDNLAYPMEGSALFYYRQVLEADADNARALDGIDRIAERYAVLAERDISSGQMDSAATFVSRGLSVDSDNERLLRLEAEIEDQRGRLPRRIADRVKSIFQ